MKIETYLLSFQNFSLISFSLFVKITNSFYGLSMTIDVHACLTACLLTAASAAHYGCNFYWILVCTDGLGIHGCSWRCGCQSHWFSSDVVVVVASLNVPSDLLLWSIVLFFTSDCFSSLQSARLLNMFIFLSSSLHLISPCSFSPFITVTSFISLQVPLFILFDWISSMFTWKDRRYNLHKINYII